MRKKPRVLINASGVDYYGDRGNEELTEDSAPGFDFLSNVCIEWEHEAYNAEDCGTRVVIIRNGFVLAKNSEGIRRLALPFKFFIGGTYGSGEQFMSWIHIEDLVDIYLLALENAQISGSVNATSPKPVTMNEFCKNIAKAVRRPSFFRIPPFAIKIAAGESASLILNGRKVLPDKLCKSGFRFKYLNLPAALNDVIKS
jgi:uncharacterized protein (TIGR01777 family)